MQTDTAILVVTILLALGLFAQNVLPFLVSYFGTEQDRWFSRGVQKSQRIDARHQQFFEHLAETTKTQSQIVATLQVISQTQNDLHNRVTAIDRSLLVLSEKHTDMVSDIIDIKDYTERTTELAMGFIHNERQRKESTD